MIKENRIDEIGLSQYNQIGNAVPPRMAEAVGHLLIEMEKEMTYDEMIERLSNLNVEQELTLEEVPHCSNLLISTQKKRLIQERLFNDIVNLYIATRTIPFTPDNISSYIYNITHAVNEYMNFYWPPSRNPFPAQADYTSSIIPEMLCLIFHNISKELNEEIRISAQRIWQLNAYLIYLEVDRFI